MRIGISVLSVEGASYWSNGLRQNALFLAQLLSQTPGVEKVWLLETGKPELALGREHFEALGLSYANPADVTDEIDLAIELVGTYDVRWKRLLRARGKKVVYYCCGQPLGLVESAIFERGGAAIEIDQIDEVWLLPEYSMYSAMLSTMYRCPVHSVPYLWSPYLLEHRIHEIAQSGLHFGYQRRNMQEGDKGFRLAIFEPNVSVVKCSAIPMLACDEAYRVGGGHVEFMNVLCSDHMIQHPTMLYLGNSLDLVRDHKAVFVGRHDMPTFMAGHANAVVSHQWNNDQNYSYLDALYGNYPLIHNSNWLWKGFSAGYYYPDFDAAKAGEQIIAAWEHHDDNLADYKSRSQKVFQAVSPSNETNISTYARLIRELVA